MRHRNDMAGFVLMDDPWYHLRGEPMHDARMSLEYHRPPRATPTFRYRSCRVKDNAKEPHS